MFGLGTILLGELLTLPAVAVLVLLLFNEGLGVVESEPCTGLRTEYGPAVAGLAISGRERDFAGLIGATERPPWETDVKDEVASGLPLTLPFSNLPAFGAGPFGADEEDMLRTGDAKLDMADPGRGGKLFAAIAAALF